VAALPCLADVIPTRRVERNSAAEQKVKVRLEQLGVAPLEADRQVRDLSVQDTAYFADNPDRVQAAAGLYWYEWLGGLAFAAAVEELSFYGRMPNLNGMLFTQVPVIARQKGFKTTFLEGSVGKVKNAVDRGVPPIIGVQSGSGNYHCFVVIGYNDKEQTLVCEEYHDTKRLISYEEIETLWQPAGHLMLELEVSRAEELFVD